jgi:hypothetical protein
MAANGTFTELVTTTYRKHKKDIADNLSNRNALYKYMMKKGNKRMEDGGLSIVTPLDYASNSTYQRFTDWDVLNIGASDVISAAEYQWRQVAMHIVASGRELLLNSGETQIKNLAKAKMKNMIRTFENSFSSDLYSDGSASNQIDGLQKIIADTNTNTVGGIDASTTANTFWRNRVTDASALSVTTSATTIEASLMLPTWLAVDRGPSDSTDLILMDSVYFTYFEASQLSLKRYADSSSADAGFVTMKYKNADVVYDNGGIPASHAYFINTNYLELVVHQDADMEVMPAKEPINQHGEVIPMFFMGNLTCSNRFQQAVIHE